MNFDIQDPNNFIVSWVGKLMFDEEIERDLVGNTQKKLQDSNLILNFPQSNFIEAGYKEVIIVNLHH